MYQKYIAKSFDLKQIVKKYLARGPKGSKAQGLMK